MPVSALSDLRDDIYQGQTWSTHTNMEGSEYYYSMVQWSIMWLLVLIVVSCLFFFFFWESRVCWRPEEKIENLKRHLQYYLKMYTEHMQLYVARLPQCPMPNTCGQTAIFPHPTGQVTYFSTFAFLPPSPLISPSIQIHSLDGCSGALPSTSCVLMSSNKPEAGSQVCAKIVTTRGLVWAKEQGPRAKTIQTMVLQVRNSIPPAFYAWKIVQGSAASSPVPCRIGEGS